MNALNNKMNKKGAEMAIGTIVVIVLALVVLVILVYGFSSGWSNLWDKITGFGGGEVNVQTHVQSCTVACSTNNVYGWCSQVRKVIFEEGGEDQPLMCYELASKNVGLSSCSITCPAKSDDVPAPEDVPPLPN